MCRVVDISISESTLHNRNYNRTCNCECWNLLGDCSAVQLRWSTQLENPAIEKCQLVGSEMYRGGHLRVDSRQLSVIPFVGCRSWLHALYSPPLWGHYTQNAASNCLTDIRSKSLFQTENPRNRNIVIMHPLNELNQPTQLSIRDRTAALA